MRFVKRLLVFAAAATLMTLLDGCASSMIGVRNGSDRVSLAEKNQVARCQSKGNITVSVLAKVGFIKRSTADVEANLFQLARNEAVDAGADTLVKDESQQFGTRTFGLYKCRP